MQDHSKPEEPQSMSFVFPLIMVTSLFFMWGFAISMLDVLNKHFQDALNVTRAQSGLIQFVVYGSYFVVALPAGYLMNRFGYQRGILIGLALYAVGAFLFYPATQVATFGFFLAALFIIGCGLAVIETGANPYVTVLGKPEGAARRLNLAQSFNGLGVILGPLIGGLALFKESDEATASDLSSIQAPYLTIGTLVLLLLLIFSTIKLPEVHARTHANTDPMVQRVRLFSQPHFVYGVIAQFFYIGAQAGVWGFFINYAVEEVPGISNKDASFYLSGAMVLYTFGRFSGAWLMKYVAPRTLLAWYAFIALVAMIVVMTNGGILSLCALMIGCFCMSIMFPTIFSLGILNLGSETKRAGSYMIMSIVGGAVIPPIMGRLADTYQMSVTFALPAICYAIVLLYALKGCRSVAIKTI